MNNYSNNSIETKVETEAIDTPTTENHSQRQATETNSSTRVGGIVERVGPQEGDED